MGRVRTKSTAVFNKPWMVNNGSWTERGVIAFNSSETMEDGVHKYSINGDKGGAMTHTKSSWSVNADFVDYGFMWGPLIPQFMYSVDDFNDPEMKVTIPGELDLFAMGGTAISRTIPTNPAFSLSQFLGELRQDGLPRLPGSTLKNTSRSLHNKSGDEYLNVEFGWAPMVRDLHKFAHAVKGSHEILKQYRKGSDQKIRRRYAFPDQSNTKIYRTGVNGAGAVRDFCPNINLSSGLGNGIQISTRSVRTWFSGAFRYHIPVADSVYDKFAEWSSNADKLLGVKPTPEAVWNLTPWSWAVDWFSNTGDVLNNISRLGSDGLVLQYGYIMCESKYARDISATFPASQHGASSSHYEELRQVRRVASPYGFGFNMATLTASQDAVLVALGLSKGFR